MTPIFISGTGRSGTTIVRDALSRHENIATLPVEPRFIADPCGLLDLTHSLSAGWTPQAADAAISRFELLMDSIRANPREQETVLWRRIFRRPPPPYAAVQLDTIIGKARFDNALRTFIAALSEETEAGRWVGSPQRQRPPRLRHTRLKTVPELRAPAMKLLDDLFSNNKRSFWVDDTPYAFLRAVELFDLFPGARILHIHRHPADIVASNIGRPWAGNSPYLIAQRICSTLMQWERQYERLSNEYKAQVIEISIEEIVGDPVRKMHDLLTFIGADPTFAKQTSNVFSSDKAHLGRWHDELTNETMRECKPFLHAYAQRYNYDL